MNKFIYILLFPLTLLCFVLLYTYKLLISPFLPHTCKFSPSCSTYMVQAIKTWGVFKGVWLGVKRVLRCNPWSKGGVDSVPLNLKGEHKWIF